MRKICVYSRPEVDEGVERHRDLIDEIEREDRERDRDAERRERPPSRRYAVRRHPACDIRNFFTLRASEYHFPRN